MKGIGIMIVFVCLLGCRPQKIIVQEKVIQRDSVVYMVRDTVIYVEIERVVNSAIGRITDTVYLENKFSYAISYVSDSTLFLELVQKQQELEFKLQYRDKEYYSLRDSVRTLQEIVEVNRLTKTQSFWVVCGYIFASIVAALLVYFVFKIVLTSYIGIK